MAAESTKPFYTFKDLISQLNVTLPASVKEFENLDKEEDLLRNPIFNGLLMHFPSVMLIFNFSKLAYEYFSPNVEKVLGYPVTQLLGISGTEFALNVIDPEHLSILIGLQNDVIMKYYYEYSAMKRAKDTRASYTCKLKKSDGTYIWTLMQTMVLEVSSDGFPLRTIIFVTDISDLKMDSKLDFVFSVKSKSGIGYDTVYSSHHDSTNVLILSRREIEVLNFIGKGFKNNDIADKLNISVNTVKTHRKNILKKTGKNIMELIK